MSGTVFRGIIAESGARHACFKRRSLVKPAPPTKLPPGALARDNRTILLTTTDSHGTTLLSFSVLVRFADDVGAYLQNAFRF